MLRGGVGGAVGTGFWGGCHGEPIHGIVVGDFAVRCNGIGNLYRGNVLADGPIHNLHSQI